VPALPATAVEAAAVAVIAVAGKHNKKAIKKSGTQIVGAA
jgi:hypothetical protein